MDVLEQIVVSEVLFQATDPVHIIRPNIFQTFKMQKDVWYTRKIPWLAAHGDIWFQLRGYCISCCTNRSGLNQKRLLQLFVRCDTLEFIAA